MGMAEVKFVGSVTASIEARTVGDLRALLAQLDAIGIENDRPIDWGNGFVFVEVADSASGDTVETIECGDHIPVTRGDVKYWSPSDFLISTHSHNVAR